MPGCPDEFKGRVILTQNGQEIGGGEQRTLFSSVQDLEEKFFRLADKEGVPFDEQGWNKSGPTIRAQVRALIARNLWDINAYYYIIQEIDDELMKSVEILDKGTLFDKLSLHY